VENISRIDDNDNMTAV